jgi:hypothetical protein
MLPENGLGLHEKHGVSKVGCRAGEQNQEPPLGGRELRLLHRPRHHDQLLAERHVLGKEFPASPPSCRASRARRESARLPSCGGPEK